MTINRGALSVFFGEIHSGSQSGKGDNYIVCAYGDRRPVSSPGALHETVFLTTGLAMTSTLLLWILALILVATGIVGLVIPALPGIVLVFAGLVVAAWAEEFAYVGQGTLVILVFLCLLGYGVDFIAGALGAKKFGAGKSAVIGATIGAVAGMFFGLPGIIAGPFIGAVAGELLVRRDLPAAGRAGIGAWIGLVAGTAAKIAIVFIMVGVFVLARFL